MFSVLQMAVVWIMLVMLTALISSIACNASDNISPDCMPLDVNYGIEDSGITINWNDVPCVVAVNLTHYINGELSTSMVIPSPISTWQLSRVSCSINEVMLQAVLLSAAGAVDNVMLSFRAGIIGSGKIQDLNFNEDTNRFEWIPPNESENCNIEYQVNYKSDSTELTEIVPEEFYEISVYPCSTNEIQVKTLITFNDAESEPVIYSFIGPTTPPRTDAIITDIFQNSDGISIYWTQPYNSEFITGYMVHIQPEGPNHFIPDDCVVDLTPIAAELPPDINSYVIENPKSSFIYTLSVTTFYASLGMTSQTYNELVYTEEDTPGDLTLEATYDYIPASRYNVNLVVQWDVPCDVNGKLQSFTYKLIGALKSELPALCSDIILSSGTITPIEQDRKTYSFEVANIIPSFEYMVEITTNLADHFSTNTKLLDDPPEAYTANT